MEVINIIIASKIEENGNPILTGLSEQKGYNIKIEDDEANLIIKSERIKPDVIIIDLQSSTTYKIDIATIIHRKIPSTSIILICNNKININEAINAGIRGIINKEADIDEIIFTISTVLKGSFYISSPYVNFYKNPTKQSVNITSNLNSPLTSVEKQIVTHLAKGCSDTEIAERINYGAGTIRNMILGIKRKTKLKNRVQIVLYSYFSGLVKLKLQDLFENDNTRKKNVIDEIIADYKPMKP